MAKSILLHLTAILILAHTTPAWSQPPFVPLPEDSLAAILLAYSGIDEETSPESRIHAPEFLAHLDQIEKSGGHIVTLESMIAALRGLEALPARSIALTFDHARRSAYMAAFPLLIARKIPFTVFYNPDDIALKSDEFMNSKELKELSRHDFVSIGLIPFASSDLLADQKEGLRLINRARQKYRDLLGREADYMAYPDGRIFAHMKSTSKSQGFKAAFGLHSGAIYKGADLYATPRFVMSEYNADLSHFRSILDTLPLPVKDITPPTPDLGKDPFHLGFTLPAALTPYSKNLQCLIYGMEKPAMEIIDGGRIELRLKQESSTQTEFPVSCTLDQFDATTKTARTRWFGVLLHKAPLAETTPPPDELPAPPE